MRVSHGALDSTPSDDLLLTYIAEFEAREKEPLSYRFSGPGGRHPALDVILMIEQARAPPSSSCATSPSRASCRHTSSRSPPTARAEANRSSRAACSSCGARTQASTSPPISTTATLSSSTPYSRGACRRGVQMSSWGRFGSFMISGIGAVMAYSCNTRP